MKKFLKPFVIIILIIVVLVGILYNESRNRVRVFTTIEPIVFFTERIGGDHVEVFNISQGTSIQNATVDFEVLEQIRKDDVFFYISDLDPHFAIYESYLREKGVKMYDLSLDSIRIEYMQYLGDQEFNDDKVSILSDFYRGEFNDLNLFTFDPFIWIDPVSAMSLSATITNKLSEILPAHAREFNESHERIKYELAVISARHHQDDQELVTILSLSNSFTSLQRAYNVSIIPISITRNEQMPSEKQMDMIRQSIEKYDISHIAIENNMSPQLIQLGEQLASEYGLQTIYLDNLSLSDFSASDRNFLTQLENNLAQLALIRE